MAYLVLLLVFLPSTLAFNFGVSSSMLNNAVNTVESAIDSTIAALSGTDTHAKPFSFTRQTVDRDDLICSGCDDADERYDKCCACKYIPKWRNQEENLQVEYISALGKSLVVPLEEVKNDTVYKVHVRHGVMGEIPSNICSWDTDARVIKNFNEIFQEFEMFSDKVVHIDFTGNAIRKLPDINCLSSLDTLNLGHNRISHLSNDSFNYLSHLRVLDLRNNLITTMDPSVLTTSSLHLTKVYLQNNQLRELDMTNCMSLYPFCTIDYSHNQIRELTNVHNYKFDTSQTEGPGYVSFQNNNMIHFPDLKNILNLGSIQELGQLLEFGFDLRGNPVQCDGLIAPYLEVARLMPDSFWRNYMDVVCDGPESLKGRLIKDIKIEEFVTDYTCYQDCDCQDRPSADYVYVNCSNKGITDLTKGELPNPPFCNNIHLNLANNTIRIVPNISNLETVTELDISNNNLVEINEEAALQLENLTQFVLTNNSNLRAIPEQFKYLNACSIYLDGIVLDCDCESIWISDLANKNTCDENTTLGQCRVPNHGLMPAIDFQEDMLQCKHEDTFFNRLAAALIAVIVTLITIAIVTYQLRYELLIIMLRLRRRKRNEILPNFSYDLYLSFDEENQSIQKWVNKDLIPELEGMGYNCFLPYRDIEFGAIRDNVTIDVLAKTRNFLVILSQSYLDQEESRWADLEWKHGWHMFKANKFKNIVIVNYDHLSSFDVDHAPIKAFLRVGGPVGFTNRSRNIMEQISSKLGPPFAKTIHDGAALGNPKAKFNVAKLFLVAGQATDYKANNKYEICPAPLYTCSFKAFENNRTQFDKTNLNLRDLHIEVDGLNFHLKEDTLELDDQLSTDDESND